MNEQKKWVKKMKKWKIVNKNGKQKKNHNSKTKTQKTNLKKRKFVLSINLPLDM